MNERPLYQEEVIPNNLILIKECLGQKPNKNDRVKYIIFRSHRTDYRWACIEKTNGFFAIDHPENAILYKGAYRNDIFEQLGVINP